MKLLLQMPPVTRTIIILTVSSAALYVAGNSMGSSDAPASSSIREPAPVRELSDEEQKDRCELAARRAWLDYVDRLKESVLIESNVIGAYRAAGGIDASNAAGTIVGQDPEVISSRARAARESGESQVSLRLRAIADAEALEKSAMAANPRYWGLEIERMRDAEAAKREGR